MKKLDNLLEKDLHIVEKRKFIFITPLVIAVIAAIMMIIFNFTLGSPLYLGTDFGGGFSIEVGLNNKLTDDNYNSYCDRIEEVLSDITTENGKTYKIDVDGFQKQGEGSSSSIYVKCFAIKGVDDTEMSDQIYPAIQSALEGHILGIIPTVEFIKNDGGAVTQINVNYNEVVNAADFKELQDKFGGILNVINQNESNIVIDGDVKAAIVRNSDNKKQIVITCSSANDTDAVRKDLVENFRIEDWAAGDVARVGFVGATVSTELLFSALLAVVLALIFMLCYIGLRFQLSSGLACIIALFHDILIMFCGMAIFRIEINSTFIAALITILGYSINNSIIVFDRVRENMRSVYAKNMTPEEIANKSVRETLMRSINTTITTLIMITMVAIIGVHDIRIFALPIIIGLLAGTFSSIFMAPSLWALFQRVGKKSNKNITVTKAPKKDKSKEPVTEVQA